MRLSVIILNYNVRYFLELCLKSVQAAIKDMDAEIIVVDNHSKDASCEMVKSVFPEVLLIENKDNLGFSKANNQAVKQAKGEYVCILNPDTVVSESCFMELLGFAEQQKQMGAIGCQLIDGNGNFLPESKRNVPLVKVAAQKMVGKTDKYYANHIQRHEIAQVDILVGAFMFMKRSVYQEVGGFDEDYFMYGEDIDLSYKLLKAGYQNFYFGQQLVLHFKGESTMKDAVYAKNFHQAMQIFYNKHFKRQWYFNTLVELGTKLLSKRPVKTEQKSIDVKNYIIITDNELPKLEAFLEKRVDYTKLLDTYTDQTEYILDGNFLSYSQIIEYIALKPENKDVTFKILPKSSNFILGSNSSKTRGDKIQF